MGVKAVELLKNYEINKIVALKGNEYVAYDIEEALKMRKHIDENMIATSKMLSL